MTEMSQWPKMSQKKLTEMSQRSINSTTKWCIWQKLKLALTDIRHAENWMFSPFERTSDSLSTQLAANWKQASDNMLVVNRSFYLCFGASADSTPQIPRRTTRNTCAERTRRSSSKSGAAMAKQALREVGDFPW